MTDSTHQTLTILTYELSAIGVDQVAFYRRLHKLNPDLVSADDVQVAEQRLNRLRTLFKNLQRQQRKDA